MGMEGVRPRGNKRLQNKGKTVYLGQYAVKGRKEDEAETDS